jgi:hypothetical protein
MRGQKRPPCSSRSPPPANISRSTRSRYQRDLFTELPKIESPTEKQLDFWLPDAWASQPRRQFEAGLSQHPANINR